MFYTIPAGTTIIREGDANTDMYKIITGHVELYSGYGTENEAILGIKSKDDYFGEMGLFSGGKPAIYTAIAYSDLLVVKIKEKDILKFILDNHSDVLRIMKNMAESMYRMQYAMNLYVEDLMKEKNGLESKDFASFVNKEMAKYQAGFATGVKGEASSVNFKA